MSIKDWNPSVLPLIREFIATRVPFNQLLGIEVSELKEGCARLEIPFRPEFIGDPFRPALHGGVMSSLIDAAGGAAVYTLITPPDTVSTIDLRVDYLRPGALERIVCTAQVIRPGNRVASVDMVVFHPSSPEHLIAVGRGVYNVKRAKR